MPPGLVVLLSLGAFAAIYAAPAVVLFLAARRRRQTSLLALLAIFSWLGVPLGLALIWLGTLGAPPPNEPGAFLYDRIAANRRASWVLLLVFGAVALAFFLWVVAYLVVLYQAESGRPLGGTGRIADSVEAAAVVAAARAHATGSVTPRSRAPGPRRANCPSASESVPMEG